MPGGRRKETPGTVLREFRARWAAGRCYLTRFRGKTVTGGRRERLPGTLSRGYRGRWAVGKDTWNDFAGIPWQVDSGMRHLERFSGDTVASGRWERLPGTLSREFRARWAARGATWHAFGGATWHAFAGIPWQVGGGEMLPGTLSREFRGRWAAGRCHMEHFRRDSVPGGRRGDATWNTFAGIPCQVDGGEMPPGTLSQGCRGKWAAEKDTWHAFAGKPWQVDSGMRHLERFCGDSVPGGKREGTPGTLLRGFRARWAAGRCHLEHFCGDSVPGGRRGDATWNTFAGIPCQVGGKKGYLEQPQPQQV